MSEMSDEAIQKIAKAAAKEAVAEVAQQFYASVGKGVVFRVLTWIGLLVIGYAVGHGGLKL